MSTIRKHLLIIFVSPEFMCVLLALTGFVFPDWIQLVVKHISLTSSNIKYLCLLPAIFSAGMVKHSPLFFPDEDLRGRLQKWEGYDDLKASYLVGIGYCILFSIASVTVMIFNQFPTPLGLTIVLAAILGSGLSWLTTWLAVIRVKELFRQHIL
jgi:hypothetical protein